MQYIEDTGGFSIVKEETGYRIYQHSTNKHVLVQGQKAELFIAHYNEIKREFTTPHSNASRQSWADNMDDVCGGYFD